MNLDVIKIRPITNKKEFMEAGKIINLLIDADLIENPIERKKALDILGAISILACEYEQKHYSIPKPNPIEAVCERALMLHNKNRKKMYLILDELHAEAKANGLTDEILAELLADEE